MSTPRSGVHPSAIVSDGAVLGADVRIGPGCVVGPHVNIGAGTILHEHVVIDGKTTIGEECELFPFCALGKRPQDKKIQGRREWLIEEGFLDDDDNWIGPLTIGNHAEIREYVSIHGGTPWGAGHTTLGNDVMLLGSSHIGHDSQIGDDVVFTNGAMVAGHTQVDEHSILGAMAGVHQHTRVGRCAMLGAGSMASHDVPPFSMVQGDRARLVAVNLVGLRRLGFKSNQTAMVKRVYRLLFWRSGLLRDRIDGARAFADGDPLAEEIFHFIESTNRGVCAPRDTRGFDDDSAE